MARRWTFYIAPDGKILHIDKAVKAGVVWSGHGGQARLS